MHVHSLKRRLIFLFAILSLGFTSNTFARKIQGKIIYRHDTIDVIFNIPFKLLSGEPNFEKLQYRVKYYDASGEVFKLKPDDAEEIRFKINNKEFRMLSRHNSLGGGLFSGSSNIFLELVSDGAVKIFNYYYTQHTPGMYGAGGMVTSGTTISQEKYVLQKGNGTLVRPVGISFKKDMMTFFSDCPELVKRIDSKELRKSDLLLIVSYYNNSCM